MIIFYQGTIIFIIPYNRYQPTEEEYVITHNYYGSCSGCDALMGCQGWGEKVVEESTIKGIMSIALHLLERMKPLYEMTGEDE